METPRGRGRGAKRLLLALAPPVVILGAVEAAFRVREQRDWWDEMAATQVASENLPYESNSDHLRDRDYESPRPPGRVRVLLLGDSFTYGYGVPAIADVFPELLEARLNDRKPDPAKESYEVLNAAVPALPASSWAVLAEAAERRFEPDLVIAVFFLRDGTSITFGNEFFEPIRARMKEWRETSPAARLSAAWRWWRGRRLALEMSSEYVQRFRRAYLGPPEETQEWARSQKALVRIRDFYAKRGVRFELVLFPVLFQFGPDYLFQPILDVVERFAQRNDIPCFSLLPALEHEDPRALWVSPADQHPNELCHRLVADALEPRLRTLLAEVVPRN
jgi:lysophospholipase L1-like esterase